MNFELLSIPVLLQDKLYIAWTFFLLVARFTGMFMCVPGIGMGVAGLVIRAPAIMVLAMAAMASSPTVPLPADSISMLFQLCSELMLGVLIGMIPLMVISGVQTAGHLSGVTMGLQPSQLIDPALNLSLPDTARIFGDLAVIVFLIFGGHHVVIHAAAGLGGTVIPGSFLSGEISLDVLVLRSADIFKFGVILASPVLVALLLTNFVMGLITKMVPTVNIFIVSFPLTIGIGLILSVLVLPEMIYVISSNFHACEGDILRIFEDARRIQ